MVIVTELLKALEKIEGLRPSVPEPARSWINWDVDTMAVDVEDELVCVRVVATRLPLAVDEAGAALRAVLLGTQWEDAPIRIVVTDVDKRALDHLNGS
ncbi:hypothetical protein [Lentzea sp. NBRC 102530]|uniref:hypothetical protein n=1 Tax=Lentzea sp. NBRC 102530 TaxID=3032201 RepID=UPI0024A1B68F|nr:hypothetical protein [Lentzea sp. NBRC 102530]GLY53571.1 hypothetical protein Lesp01_72270 [Lentzea sp. NBRC 102530]